MIPIPYAELQELTMILSPADAFSAYVGNSARESPQRSQTVYDEPMEPMSGMKPMSPMKPMEPMKAPVRWWPKELGERLGAVWLKSGHQAGRKKHLHSIR